MYSESQEQHVASDRRVALLLCLVLIPATVLVYSPSFDYPFVDYDDPHYVSQNPHVQAGLNTATICWAFTTFTQGNWHPLTWLSLQLDAQLFGGQNAGAFHRTNVLLHAANTLLLFLVLGWMTGKRGRSAVVAGLFALHPLHVESVAWVTERKDVLSTFFWFATLAAYLFYLQRPSVLRYLLLVLGLALGLLAKPMLVTLPFALLLLDYWPLHRWPVCCVRSLLLEKAPLFVLIVVSCVVTFYAQLFGQSVAPLEEVPLTARLESALLAYVNYLGKMFWPAHLAVYYPHLGLYSSVIRAIMAGLLLAAVTILVLGTSRRRPYLAVGWLWYLGTLVPVIGLVQVGGQGMADRYTYVPLLGLFVTATWSAADLAAALTRTLPPVWGRVRVRALAAVAVLVLTACAARTWKQVGCWKSTRQLWECTVAATDNNVLAYLNLGTCYLNEGRIGDAKRAFEQAVAIDPRQAVPHVNLGNVFGQLGLWDRAAAEYRQSLKLNPRLAHPHYNLGNALAQLGHREEAIAEYRRAIDLDPNDVRPYINLSIQLDYLGRWQEAEAHLRSALSLDPTNAEVHSDLGILLLELDRPEEAIAEFREAISRAPQNGRYHSQLAAALQEEGRLDEAWAEYRAALDWGDRQARPRLGFCERLRALQPRLADVIAGRDQPADNSERLAFALLCQQRQQRRYAWATRLYREAFRIEPQLADDSRNGHRFLAAAAAAAAGCGQDTVPLNDKEMTELRRQALEWLQAELDFWARLAQSGRPEVRAAAERMLRRWQRDTHFAGVRDPALLAQRPESERQAWRKLWDEVAALLSQIDSPPKE